MIPSTRWWPLPERHELPVLTGCAYLNAGTNGPMPRAATDAMAAEVRTAAELPRIGKAAIDNLLGLRARARAGAARALGAAEDEVALTSSTSHGIGLVCAGLDWSAGGEVVTTTEEHPGLLGPLDELATGTASPCMPCRRTRSSRRSARARRWSPSRTSCGRPASSCRCPRSPPPPMRSARWCWWTARSRAERSRSRWRRPAPTSTRPRARNGCWGRRAPALCGCTRARTTASGRRLRATSPTTARSASCAPGAARFDAGSLDTTVLAGFATAVEWVEGQPGGRAAWLALGAERAAVARRRLGAIPGVSVFDPGGPVQRADRTHGRRPRAGRRLCEPR